MTHLFFSSLTALLTTIKNVGGKALLSTRRAGSRRPRGVKGRCRSLPVVSSAPGNGLHALHLPVLLKVGLRRARGLFHGSLHEVREPLSGRPAQPSGRTR